MAVTSQIQNNLFTHVSFHVWTVRTDGFVLPVILRGRLLRPGGRGLCDEGHVIVGAGGRLVREVGGEDGRSVVFDDDGVILRHVDRRRELIVTCREGTRVTLQAVLHQILVGSYSYLWREEGLAWSENCWAGPAGFIYNSVSQTSWGPSHARLWGPCIKDPPPNYIFDH